MLQRYERPDDYTYTDHTYGYTGSHFDPYGYDRHPASRYLYRILLFILTDRS